MGSQVNPTLLSIWNCFKDMWKLVIWSHILRISNLTRDTSVSLSITSSSKATLAFCFKFFSLAPSPVKINWRWGWFSHIAGSVLVLNLLILGLLCNIYSWYLWARTKRQQEKRTQKEDTNWMAAEWQPSTLQMALAQGITYPGWSWTNYFTPLNLNLLVNNVIFQEFPFSSQILD